jgi:predicted RNA-binding Zn ribbon-like protein
MVDARQDMSEVEEPGGRPPAPLRLRLVQQFLNSNDIEGARDVFATTGGLRNWLLDRSLIGGSEALEEADRQRGVNLREALRTLVIARDEGIAALGATKAIEGISRDMELILRIEPGAWDLAAPPAGVGSAYARILADVISAISDGSWSRLKACRRDACRWVFWDSSRNRSGQWCAMAVCGNRIKGAAFRARRGTRPAIAEDAIVNRVHD